MTMPASEIDGGELNINQVDLMQQVTFKVTMTHQKEWRIRMWIAKQLLFLAAWIANSNIEFKNG
jgi:hypothetical protein